MYLPQFDDDRDTVVKQAIDAGVNKILIPGIDVRTSEQAIKLCAYYPNTLYAAIGIHPNSKNDFNKEAIAQLNILAKSEYVVAIGEIGLDYYRLVNPIDQQKAMFQSQLELASELGLPVCIHNRDAFEDIVDIVDKCQIFLQERNHQPIPYGVFHSFNGTLEIAKRIISIGFFLGITGPVTYPSNHEFRDVIKMLSLDNLLIETDAPYLPPQPFRGKRNIPFYVKYVAQQISEIYKIDIETVKNITSKNANKLFNWQ